ncbi:MAG: hypothetical protein R6V58_12230 [Planctomycetota bacterium]
MNRLRVGLFAGLLALPAGTALAPPQQMVRHTSFQDFRKGETENVAVLGSGALALGPEFAPVEAFPPQAYVWALVADSKGRVYAATGNGGTVFVVEDGKARPALETDDLEVLCLAVDGDDTVYAGCAPSGRIYRIPPDGKPSVFCETGQTYIWALARAKSGHLYAGTGPEGKILRISPKGRNVKTVFDSTEKHILGVVAAGDSVYAGSDGSGLVYRISDRGEVSIAYDAPQAELRCMAADGAGNVYVGSADGIRPAPKKVPQRVPMNRPPEAKSGNSGNRATNQSASHTAKRPPAQPGPKKSGAAAVDAINVVYRIAPDGRVTELFRIKGMAFLSMAWHRGALYVGTAGEGRIIRIVSEKDVAVLGALDRPQVLSLCGGRSGELVAGTGNDGRLYRAASLTAEEGTYTSPVHDAGLRSAWGTFKPRGVLPRRTAVRLSTRSGNSEKPDGTWSAWSKPVSAEEGRKIESPPARFLQYRLTLSTRSPKATPQVNEITFPYLQENYAPSVDAIDVGGPPGPDAKNGQKKGAPDKSAGGRGANGIVSGTVSVSWRASDRNGDALSFELFFRGRNETNWKRLDNEPAETRFGWDTHAVPDGTYELKVCATDAPANPPPRARTDCLVSQAVAVDNSPPVVKITRTRPEGRRSKVDATVTDAGSEIAAARYSVDAGEWKPLLPVDELFDQKTERLALTTDELEPGEHTLVIQAEDRAGNVGAAKTVFEIAK